MIVTSFTDQAPLLSRKHFCGAQPIRPAPFAHGSCSSLFAPPERTPGGAFG